MLAAHLDMKDSLMLRACIFVAALALAPLAHADQSDFTPGPAIANFGAVAEAPTAAPVPANTVFKVAFSVHEAGEAETVNRRLDSPARFINMHVRAGVPRENIHLAVVVHGPASRDLLRARASGEENPNAPLIAALIANGVDVYLCGQSAAAYDIAPEDLLPGVQIALSAMTVHALLQQAGYTINPF